MTLASLFSGKPVRSDVGITGEMTLRGRVLPVGGIKMKALAAHRAGLKTVILPKKNQSDLDELPDEVRNAMEFVTVDRIDDVVAHAFAPCPDAVAVEHGEPAPDPTGGNGCDTRLTPLAC
jgi:ATP-dependent Lon protease